MTEVDLKVITVQIPALLTQLHSLHLHWEYNHQWVKELAMVERLLLVVDRHQIVGDELLQPTLIIVVQAHLTEVMAVTVLVALVDKLRIE